MENMEETKVTEQSFDSQGITGLEIYAKKGCITLAAGKPGEEIRVKAVKEDGTGGQVMVAVAGGIMRITAKGNGFFTCGEQGVIVSAPPSIRTDIKAGAGDIKVLNMENGLDIKTGTGDVQLAGCAGKLSLSSGTGDLSGTTSSNETYIKIGTGDVRLSGLTGSADIKSGSGDIELVWAALPGNGECRIMAGSGDVTLRFPGGAKINATIKAGSGDVANSLPQTPDGFPVLVMCGSGDVKISDTVQAKAS